jgi:Flp pilus assembly protein TadB
MDGRHMLTAGLWGAAAFAAGWAVLRGARPTTGDRIADWFGPVIDRLADRDPGPVAAVVDEQLRITGDVGTGARFIARHRVVGALVGGAAAGAVGLVLGPVGIAVGLLVGWYYPRGRMKDLAGRARDRVAEVRRRLPFAVDLLAAQLEAGATLTAAVELTGGLVDGPTGRLFTGLAREVRGGRSLAAAVRDATVLWADPDLTRFAADVVRAEENGTANAAGFREIARRMRLQAAQWAERAAEEAKMKMTGPVMIILLACLLVILAPFVLDAQAAWRGDR